MENEPSRDENNSRYVPDAFNNSSFLFDVKNAEDIVRRAAISRSELHGTIYYVEEILNGYVGAEYLNSTVEVTGRAYFGDYRGELIRENGGRPKTDLIHARGLNFIGMEMLYVKHDDSEPRYRAFCRFNRSVGDTNLETFYIAPDDMIIFRPTPEIDAETGEYADISADEENQLIKSILTEQANNSRKILTSPRFTLARGEEQHRILRACAQDAADFFKDEYGKNTIEIVASEFMVLTEAGIQYVDQKSKPMDEWNMPMGQFSGCTFYELIAQPPNSKIRSMQWRQPSIALLSEETGSLYLVPLLAFESASIVED